MSWIERLIAASRTESQSCHNVDVVLFGENEFLECTVMLGWLEPSYLALSECYLTSYICCWNAGVVARCMMHDALWKVRDAWCWCNMIKLFFSTSSLYFYEQAFYFSICFSKLSGKCWEKISVWGEMVEDAGKNDLLGGTWNLMWRLVKKGCGSTHHVLGSHRGFIFFRVGQKRKEERHKHRPVFPGGGEYGTQSSDSHIGIV